MHLDKCKSSFSSTKLSNQLYSSINIIRGIARRPPSQILEQLTNLNKVLGLGHMLCRSRSPDFLLDIIQRQGTSQSMPWLAELVNSAEGSLDVLPVQCLCEFLLHDNQEFTFGGSQSDEGKRKQVCLWWT